MYALKNKVQLIGHLGATPDIRNLESGRKHARFSLATTETYKNDKGEKVHETQWHKIVCWGKVADLVEKYCDKGSEIALEGRLMHRQYEDKEGVKKYITEVEIHEILLLDKPKAKDNE